MYRKDLRLGWVCALSCLPWARVCACVRAYVRVSVCVRVRVALELRVCMCT